MSANPVADFGPLIVETDVDYAVIETLKLWLPHYLGQVETERNLGAHFLPRPKPRSITNALDDDEYPDQLLPCVVVTTAQIDDFTKYGDGNYSGVFAVEVSSVVRGPRPARKRTGELRGGTRFLAALWSGSVRRCIEHQQSLGGFAAEVRPQSARLRPVADPTGEGRYLARGVNNFLVYVDQVLNEQGGPWIPPVVDGSSTGPYEPPDPGGDPDGTYDPPAQVTSVDVEIDGIPVTSTPGD